MKFFPRKVPSILCIFSLLALALPVSKAQVSNDLGVWVDHLPYSRGVDVVAEDKIIYLASEQGVFFLDLRDRVIQRLSKVNGLNDVGITNLEFSEEYQTFLVGYENGNLDLFTKNLEVTNYPDILLSSNYSGLKRINQIITRDKFAYIASDFGIMAFDLEAQIVRETYIIGPQGEVLGVDDIAYDENRLYAATERGLFSASFEDPLVFFESWKPDPVMDTNINLVATFDGKVFVNKNSGGTTDSVYYHANPGDPWEFLPRSEGTNRYLKGTEDKLALCNAFAARAFDANFDFDQNVAEPPEGFSGLSPAAAVMDEKGSNLWIADQRNGLFQHFDRLFTFNFQPESPQTKKVHRMHHAGQRLYVAPAATSEVGAAIFNNDGLFFLDEFNWNHLSFNDLGGLLDAHDVVTDPTDPSHYYVSMYGAGILEMRDSTVVRLINETSTNGELRSFQGEDNHRIGGFTTDEEGNIWFTNSLTGFPLGRISPEGDVQSFELGAAGAGKAVSKIMYTSQDQIWIQTRGDGVIIVNMKEGGNMEVAELSSTEGDGNLPNNSVLSFAEDKDGEIWIGTTEGIAVLFSPQNIFENNRNFDASIIVIDEDGDGNGERVLGSETINDIEVDGSNKKWFATSNSGVFYTSENGRQQLNHFTASNSPLPSDNVIDVEINDETGMVYFGTDEGMVSFQGSATEGVITMTDVFAYPNPVEPDYEGPILIRGLVTNAQVKITDIQGNIVFETEAEGGQAIWSGRDFSGQRVSSGVYLAFITDDLGGSTQVAKILIVN